MTRTHCLAASYLELASEKGIGSRVIKGKYQAFIGAVIQAIDRTNFNAQKIPERAVIDCPEAMAFVSSGIGPRSSEPKDYVTRIHYGRAQPFLKRKFATEMKNVQLVVYTVDAYLTEIAQWPHECDEIRFSRCTHVLTEVVGYAGPRPQPSPLLFMQSLGIPDLETQTYSIEEARARALAAYEYAADWNMVAD